MGNIEYEKITKCNASEAEKILKSTFISCKPEELKLFDNYTINYDTVIRMENFYIVVDNNIVGICGYYVPKVDPNASWLSWLAIKENYRRKGYAESAIKWLESYCKRLYNIKTFRVYTAKDNESALKLYEKLGYKKEEAVVDKAITLTKNGSPWLKEPIW